MAGRELCPKQCWLCVEHSESFIKDRTTESFTAPIVYFTADVAFAKSCDLAQCPPNAPSAPLVPREHTRTW